METARLQDRYFGGSEAFARSDLIVSRSGVTAVRRSPALIAFLAMTGACSNAGGSDRLNFECRGGQRFSVEYDSTGVRVFLPKRELHMSPNPFHLGERFVSAEGTLIIDDDFATLVLKNDLSYRDCHRMDSSPADPGKHS